MTRAFIRHNGIPLAYDESFTPMNPKEPTPMNLSPEQVEAIRTAAQALRAVGQSGKAAVLEELIPITPIRTANEAIAVLMSALADERQKNAAATFVRNMEDERNTALGTKVLLSRDVQSLQDELTNTRRALAAAKSHTIQHDPEGRVDKKA